MGVGGKYTRIYRPCPNHERMIQHAQNLLCHYLLEDAKVDKHAAFWAAHIGTRLPYHRNIQTVRVPVYISAQPIISLQEMGCLKGELLGKTYGWHSWSILSTTELDARGLIGKSGQERLTVHTPPYFAGAGSDGIQL